MSETPAETPDRHQAYLAALDSALERGLISEEDRKRLLELLKPLLEKTA